MTEQLCKNEVAKLTNFYELLHQRFYKYKAAFSDIIVYAPVDIERTITNYKMQFSKSEDHIEKDLGPKYIVNEVDILCAELPKMFYNHHHSEFVAAERERREKKVEKFDPLIYNAGLDTFSPDQNAVILFEIYLRSILSSKRLLTEYKVSKFIFDKVLDWIRVAFNKAIAPAGDMVGPIASQSIAEPVTQMSIHKDEMVNVYNTETSKMFTGKVSELIDGIIENSKEITDYSNDSVGVNVNNLLICSVSPDEKVTWSAISEVSRHPTNGDLVKVKTRTGREIITTLSHSHLCRSKDQIIEPVVASKLKIGDRIPIIVNQPDTFQGVDLKETLDPNYKKPKLPWTEVFQKLVSVGWDFNHPPGRYLKKIDKYYDIDHIITHPRMLAMILSFKKTNLAKYDETIDMIPNVEQVINELNKCLDISVDISMNENRLKLRAYLARLENYTVPVEKQKRVVELIQTLKNTAYSDVMWDSIVEITRIKDPKEYVYDFTIPGNQTFATLSGVLVHNTLNTLNVEEKSIMLM
jgi:hypothetical protein